MSRLTSGGGGCRWPVIRINSRRPEKRIRQMLVWTCNQDPDKPTSACLYTSLPSQWEAENVGENKLVYFLPLCPWDEEPRLSKALVMWYSVTGSGGMLVALAHYICSLFTRAFLGKRKELWGARKCCRTYLSACKVLGSVTCAKPCDGSAFWRQWRRILPGLPCAGQSLFGIPEWRLYCKRKVPKSISYWSESGFIQVHGNLNWSSFRIHHARVRFAAYLREFERDMMTISTAMGRWNLWCRMRKCSLAGVSAVGSWKNL